MLSKCLNPACTSTFRYLRDGRIYQLEIPPSPNSSARIPRREYFWLCERCSSRMTVVLRDGHGSVEDRRPELASSDDAEFPGPEVLLPY